MDKFTSSTIKDTDGTINTPHNQAIEVLSCKSDLKRHIDSHRGLIMSKPLHSTEGIQVNTVRQIGNEETVSIDERKTTIMKFEKI